MRTIRDNSESAHKVSACGKMLRLSDAIIDVDGPAYKAYYHPACTPCRRCFHPISDGFYCTHCGFVPPKEAS